MPWCSFPWHKLLPSLAQNNCYAVYSLNLFHELHPCFRRRWFLQVCQGKPSRPKQAYVDISVFSGCWSDSPRFAQGQSKGGSCKRAQSQGRAQDILYVYREIYTYHHISATDLLMASTKGFVHWQTNSAFWRGAKEKVVRTTQQKPLIQSPNVCVLSISFKPSKSIDRKRSRTDRGTGQVQAPARQCPDRTLIASHIRYIRFPVLPPNSTTTEMDWSW